MELSNRMIHKSKSLSLQHVRNNKGIIDRNVSCYTDDGYVTQNNESNHSVARKSSFKHKLLSLFKTYSKHEYRNECSSLDNNVRCSLTRDSTIADSSHSTLSNEQDRIVIYPLQPKIINENRARFDPLDQQLVDQFSLHSLTESIIESIIEQPCSSIKLSSTWITNIGVHLSNRALQPFLTCVPGLMGLKNHGNTCYVNVIVQCLAHIDSVAQYFSTKDYLSDLIKSKQHRKDIVKKDNGSSLDVLVALSYLLQSLWQQTYNSKISMKFCQLLTLHKTQFSIDSQQDAHELLLYILNLLHDNLIQPELNSTEETSFIYDRFRGWLSNEIICPKCSYSRKFRDQMLSLNLTIRQKNSKECETLNNSVFCIVVINGNQPGEKYAFEVNRLTTVADIRDNIADKLGCESHDIILVEMIESGFGRLFSDDERIQDISQQNNTLSLDTPTNLENGLYAVYIPNQVVDVDALPGSSDETFGTMKQQLEHWNNQSFIRLLVVHVEKTKEYITEFTEDLRRTIHYDPLSEGLSNFGSKLSLKQRHFIRFTNVLTVQAARKTRLGLLRHSLSEQMCKYLNLRNITKLPKPQFLIEGSHVISDLDAYPLADRSVSMSLKHSADICGEDSAVVRLVVVWPFRTTQMLRFNRRGTWDNFHEGRAATMNSQKIMLHHSVDDLLAKENMPTNHTDEKKKEETENKISITDCLRDFFGLDSVSLTESWNCPSCQTTQQAHTNIKIERLPETLILMLKRFTNDQNVNTEKTGESCTLQRNQLNGTIKRDNYNKRNIIRKKEDYLNKLECFIDYPLENLDMKEYVENASDSENYMYNLVGVVNHRGSLSNGHYVAICQNSIDNQWRLYDDDRVTDISKADVVHPDAYILFYKRQLTSESNPDLNVHWSYRRLSFPDKIHRTQSPNPTTLYNKNKKYSDREMILKTRDSYATLPMSVSTNMNCSLTDIHECPLVETLVQSPYLCSSSSSSLGIFDSASVPLAASPVTDEADDFLDITTITSKVIDVNHYKCLNGYPLQRNVSNGSSDSAHDDSGAVMCSETTSHSHHSEPLPFDLNVLVNLDGDECYESMSTSPSSSSPRASKKVRPSIGDRLPTSTSVHNGNECNV